MLGELNKESVIKIFSVKVNLSSDGVNVGGAAWRSVLGTDDCSCCSGLVGDVEAVGDVLAGPGCVVGDDPDGVGGDDCSGCWLGVGLRFVDGLAGGAGLAASESAEAVGWSRAGKKL